MARTTMAIEGEKRRSGQALQTVALDRLDRKILWELDRNARVSMSQLAKSLRQGRDRIEYRVERLKDHGVITGFTTVINPHRVGLSIYKTYLRLSGDDKTQRKFIAKLRTHPWVYWIAECSGNWDLIFAMSARGTREFYGAYTDIIAESGGVVLESSFFTLMDVWIGQRAYLIDEAPNGILAYGGELGALHLDEMDFAIIQQLLADSRTPLSELSKTIGAPAATIDYRIKGMEKEGVIVGYRMQLNLALIGRIHLKSQLFFDRFSRSFEDRFRKHCLAIPELNFYSRQMGTSQVEIETEVEHYPAYSAVISNLRNAFPGHLRSVSTMLMQQTFLNWRPRQLVA